MTDRDDEYRARRSFGEWLVGQAGTALSRVLIGLVALIGTLAGSYVSLQSKITASNIGDLKHSVDEIGVRMDTLSTAVGRVKEKQAGSDAMVVEHSRRLDNVETTVKEQGRSLDDLNGRVSHIEGRVLK